MKKVPANAKIFNVYSARSFLSFEMEILKSIYRALSALKLLTFDSLLSDLQVFKHYFELKIESNFIRISQKLTSVFGYTPLEINQKKSNRHSEEV